MGNEPQIEVIVRAVIFDESHEHLLFCAPTNKEYYYLPGGHAEYGETSPKALRREIAEETEIQTDESTYLFLDISEETFVQNGEKHQELNLYYRVPQVFPTEVISKEEDIIYTWISVKEFYKFNILPRSVTSLCRDWK